MRILQVWRGEVVVPGVAAGFELIADYTAGHPALAAMLGRGPVRRRSCSICLRQAAPCPAPHSEPAAQTVREGVLRRCGQQGVVRSSRVLGAAPDGCMSLVPSVAAAAWLQGSGASGMSSNMPRAGARAGGAQGPAGPGQDGRVLRQPAALAHARRLRGAAAVRGRPPPPARPHRPPPLGMAQRHSRVSGASGAGPCASARAAQWRPRARPPRQRRTRACGCPPALTLGVRLGSG